MASRDGLRLRPLARRRDKEINALRALLAGGESPRNHAERVAARRFMDDALQRLGAELRVEVKPTSPVQARAGGAHEPEHGRVPVDVHA